MEGRRATQGTAGSRVLGATPFLKWAGGKSSLLPQLGPLVPRRFNRYFEPFLGGGAMFLHLQPEVSILGDLNRRLVDCYRAVRDEVQAVISYLEALRASHCPRQYYTLRDKFNHQADLPLAERAALQIYLNKTCFNGLYRENKEGHFNVPIGRYANPSLFDPDNLLAVSTLLKRATLLCAPFDQVLEQARAGDFIYLDPPYHPLSRTSSFTAYTSQGFDAFDQGALAELFCDLDRRGCLVMQSNSASPNIRQLYQGYPMHQVMARRSINSKGRSRGPIGELVIRNYTGTVDLKEVRKIGRLSPHAPAEPSAPR
ncbi:MAG: DNA adenine methylase [Bradymonadales bacterium]|nr:DNA adenine methylase [Bradymonadales bacterium]